MSLYDIKRALKRMSEYQNVFYEGLALIRYKTSSQVELLPEIPPSLWVQRRRSHKLFLYR